MNSFHIFTVVGNMLNVLLSLFFRGLIVLITHMAILWGWGWGRARQRTVPLSHCPMESHGPPAGGVTFPAAPLCPLPYPIDRSRDWKGGNDHRGVLRVCQSQRPVFLLRALFHDGSHRTGGGGETGRIVTGSLQPDQLPKLCFPWLDCSTRLWTLAR